jgi:hypothetical protein
MAAKKSPSRFIPNPPPKPPAPEKPKPGKLMAALPKKVPGSAIGKAVGNIRKYTPLPKSGPSYGKRPEVGPSYGQRPSKGTPIKPYVPNWDVPAGTPWKENSPYNPANPKKPNAPKKPGVVPPKKKPVTTTTTVPKTPGVAQALPKKKKGK